MGGKKEIIELENGFQIGKRFVNKQQTRFMETPEIVSKDDRSMLLSISSEQAYYRWMWDANEILVHEEGAVDLEWIRSGYASMLFNHDVDCYLGRITNAYLDQRRTMIEVYPKNTGKAGEIIEDVRNGVLGGSTSVGYEIRGIELIERDNEPDELMVVDWRVLEGSIVTIPADTSTGYVEESGGMEEEKQHFAMATSQRSKPPPDEEEPASEPEEEKRDRADEPQPVEIKEKPPMATETEERQDLETIREQERTRQYNIRHVCEKDGVSPEVADDFIQKGTKIEDVISYCQKQRSEPEPVAAPSGFLSKKEQKRYSLTRVLRWQTGMADPRSKDDDISFELEVSSYIADKTHKNPSESQGLYVPMRDLKFGMQRDAITTGSVPSGGALIDTELDVANFTEALLNETLAFQMGVRLMTGLSGNIDIPIENDTPQVFWVGEGEIIPESASTFSLASLRYKEVASITPVTRKMLIQSSMDMEAYIRQILVRKIAIGIDYAIINGSGTQNEPLGLLNYPGLLTADVGPANDGGTLDWDSIVDLQTALALRNAKRNGCGYMTNPLVEGQLRKTQKFTGDGDEIWQAPSDPNTSMSMLAGYPAGCTNQVPSNLKKGSSSKTLSALIFAYWPDVVAGEFGTMEVLGNPFGRGFYNNMVDVKATMGFDVTFVRDGTSFAAYKDVKASGPSFTRQG